ncbi:PREDICTED: protein scribble homolog [Priapulus caudatus]|uniref:Protein scribble homolog n=1 Tax=Priapulus caudatus TaxID=37621 RepID=A0ABM1EZX3_PRICU|nr:PREDICTED: protein scribble homolog [Priapulus caudatus]
MQERQGEGDTVADGDKRLSASEQRELDAEKRAAWRQARLKSLENDAIQAQMIISKVKSTDGAGDADGNCKPNPGVTERNNRHEGQGDARQEDDIPAPPSADASAAAPPGVSFVARDGDVHTSERVRVLDEKRSCQTEEHYDEATGDYTIRTVEYIEKVVEREIETRKEQIVEINVNKGKAAAAAAGANGKQS